MIKYYNNCSSPLYICFLDASKAFDRINHWMLYKKMLNRGVPAYIVRFLHTWYSTQHINIRWGNSISGSFNVINGVKQGGILSPWFFNVYMDDLSHILNQCGVGCMIADVSANHFIYADDMPHCSFC